MISQKWFISIVLVANEISTWIELFIELSCFSFSRNVGIETEKSDSFFKTDKHKMDWMVWKIGFYQFSYNVGDEFIVKAVHETIFHQRKSA